MQLQTEKINTLSLPALEDKKISLSKLQGVFEDDDYIYNGIGVVNDNIFYNSEGDGEVQIPQLVIIKEFNSAPSKYVKSEKRLFAVNVDEPEADEIYSSCGSSCEFYPQRMVEISFACLGRIMGEDNDPVNAAADGLGDGSVKIVDYLRGDSCNLTKKLVEEIATFTKNKNGTENPTLNEIRSKFGNRKTGYDLLESYQYVGTAEPQGYRWHRPDSVLIRHTYEGHNYYYILGQDEDTYFACELPKRVYTVEGAYQTLIPKGLPKNFLRHGEWFITEVKDKDVPVVEDCIGLVSCATFNRSVELFNNYERDYADTERTLESATCYEGFALPVDDPSSSRHVIYKSNTNLVENDKELRIGLDGRIYVKNFVLVHSRGDHENIELKDNIWRTFDCNTAVNSVSVDGVD